MDEKKRARLMAAITPKSSGFRPARESSQAPGIANVASIAPAPKPEDAGEAREPDDTKGCLSDMWQVLGRMNSLTVEQAAQLLTRTNSSSVTAAAIGLLAEAIESGEITARIMRHSIYYADLGTFLPDGGLDPKNSTVLRVDLDAWMLARGLSMPAATSGTTEQDAPPAPVVTVAGWLLCAKSIAAKTHKSKPQLSVDQLAKKTHEEMTTRKNAGESGMTGRGGKVPSAGTIKRHALTGIKA